MPLYPAKWGAGKNQEARENFTLLVIASAVIGIIILFVGILWIDEIIYVLGASDLLYPYCKDYLLILLLFIPACMMQTLFSNLLVTAGKPKLGLILSILAGTLNIILDYIFIVIFGFGIRGAALGTGFGYLLPTVVGLAYFYKNQDSLYFSKPKLDLKVLLKSCFNGSSEMVSQLATAITTFLFNISMMKFLGEDGVAAITIIIYSQFLLSTLYIGFSMGVAPIIGFNYGSGNLARQKKVFQTCIGFIAMASFLVFTIAIMGGSSIVRCFADEGSNVYEIATEGFRIFSFSFLCCGLNIFTSAMFTALSNGKLSAVLSFLRTFGLLMPGILLLPQIVGVNGIWLAIPIAEGIMFFVSILCLRCKFISNLSRQNPKSSLLNEG